MDIDQVMLELHRTGDTAKLVLKARPFSHETPITFEVFEQLVTEFTHGLMAWRGYRTRVTVDYYTVLGVVRSAPDDEIQQAYRALAKRVHPDTSAGATTVAMQALNEAYAVLGDPLKRQQYDRTLN